MVQGYVTGARREHFGYVPGLRALSALCILAYEVLKNAPGLGFPSVAAHRAALSTFHGFDLLLAISGFVLAAPLLRAFRARERTTLDVGRFLLDRLARTLPAYYAALAATVLAAFVASRLASAGALHTLPGARAIVLQVFLAGHGLGNDALRAVAIQLLIVAFFPALIAIYTARPGLFAALAALVVFGELFTPAHRLDLGAALAFMLGIVAADIIARDDKVGRFALATALLAGFAAFATDPLIATLPGARFGGNFGTWNPLWAVAAGALLVAAPRLGRLLTVRELTELGDASYPIVLLGAPVAALVAVVSPSLGVPMAALTGVGATLVAGVALWFAVDRFATRAAARSGFADAIARYTGARVTVRLGLLELNPSPPLTSPLPATIPAMLQTSVTPTMHPGMLATVIHRVGSPQDLSAEIDAIKRCLAETASLDVVESLGRSVRVTEPMRITATVTDAREPEHDPLHAVAVEAPVRETVAAGPLPTIDWAAVVEEMTHDNGYVSAFADAPVEATVFADAPANSDHTPPGQTPGERSFVVAAFPIGPRRSTVRIRFGPPMSDARAS